VRRIMAPQLARARRDADGRASEPVNGGRGRRTASYVLVLLPVALLTLIGFVMVLSASSVTSYARYGSSFVLFEKQMIWGLVGLALMLVASRVDYHWWRTLAYPLLGLTVVLLVVVFHPGLGHTANGSTRWIDFGLIRVQPSEMAKLAVVVFLGDLLVRKGDRLDEFVHLIVPALFPALAVIAALVMAEPDMGTTMILVVTGFAVLFVSGAPFRFLATIGGGGLVGAVGLMFSEGYRRDRILSFRDPGVYSDTIGYQAVQARIALGSGGWFGRHLGASAQKWGYLPNSHTDFIYAIIGEELGLTGTLSVLALFLMLGYAGVRVARRAPDEFGRYLAVGVTVWLLFQALVNMGAVVGLLPITGVPLPLVSSGGSSLLFSLVGAGILLNVARQDAWSGKRAGATGRR